MAQAIYVGGFERLLHKIYAEQGPEAVETALNLFGAIEEEELEEAKG